MRLLRILSVLFMTSVPSVAEHGILMGIGAGGSPLA